MRKRILSALLSVVLLLSLTPAAAAASSYKTMTLVQETTGNPNQEFVYYVPAESAYVFGPRVEMIKNVVLYTCYCGFHMNSAVPNCAAIWKDHRNAFTGHGSYSYSIGSCYKITLKHGETATMRTTRDHFSITAVQADRYPVSYSTDGKIFANYVDDLSTAELDKSIAKVKCTVTENGTFTVRRLTADSSGNRYNDVSTGDWFYPAIEYMSGKGYMTGYSDTRFGPDDALSRAMFVTILYRVSGEKVDTAKTNFTDVPQNTWYSEAVAWAVENGITTGTSATAFSPNNPVKREEMAAFLKRYIDTKGINMPEKLVMAGSPGDQVTSSSWAKDAVQYAYQYGLLLSIQANHRLRPTDQATRIDAVIAFYNLLCSSGKVDGSLLLQNR